MKKTIKLITLVALTLFLTNCNDSFMDRDPTNNITNPKYWTKVQDLKAYNTGTYSDFGNSLLFTGYGKDYSSITKSVFAMESQTDNFVSEHAEHKKYIEIAAGLDNQPTDASSEVWNWNFLNRCNIFLDNYNRVNALKEEIAPYLGETYFFRAWFYLDKVQQYGNVPLITKPLNVTSPELYDTQADRKVVADLILDDINKAIENLPASWSKAEDRGRVTKDVALALKTRIALYEGTYRKYHKLGGETKFLEAVVDAAEKMMITNKYKLNDIGNPERNLRNLFTQTDLSGNSEAIMVKMYVAPAYAHRLSGYIAQTPGGGTLDYAEDFLCLDNDGVARPTSLSTSFNDDSPEDFFSKRDPRLSQTFLNPKDSKEILADNKTLFPNLKGMTASVWTTTTGFHPIKFYDRIDDLRGLYQEINHYPEIRWAEVLLNYAEACAELGKSPSEFLPKSINLLRKRSGMPDMNPNPIMDPKYAGEGISSLLVEIRRERRVEMGFESTRYQDLMRWKQGKKLAAPIFGMRVKDSDFADGGRYKGSTVQTTTLNGHKHIEPNKGTTYDNKKRVFDENKNYLRPIPLNVLTKNPNLVPTPGWN